MTFACGRDKGNPAQDAFCLAAADPVGIEFTHEFPWLVFDCLSARGLHPTVQTVDQYTGTRRKKVSHLWSGWKDGTRIDVRFIPTGDFGAEPKFRDYWGSYELAIWQP